MKKNGTFMLNRDLFSFPLSTLKKGKKGGNFITKSQIPVYLQNPPFH
jgi:hypothetical protein